MINKMEVEIARKLQTNQFKRLEGSSGGCISSGNTYETDNGNVFVKTNHKDGAEVMFSGEYHSLLALKSVGFTAPAPLCYGKNYLAVEHFDMRPLRKFTSSLGTILANLHRNSACDGHSGGIKFGFETTTCCGFLPLCNDWETDWVQFYATHRLEHSIKKLLYENGDRQLSSLWSHLQLRIPQFFTSINVRPALLHGDLWSGNAAETENGPITFDPASFYGHSEFDLSIGKMFGGFSKTFYDSYHSILPKENGFEARQDLYMLFHHLNHWRHFGGSYKDSSLRIMSSLLN